MATGISMFHGASRLSKVFTTNDVFIENIHGMKRVYLVQLLERIPKKLFELCCYFVDVPFCVCRVFMRSFPFCVLHISLLKPPVARFSYSLTRKKPGQTVQKLSLVTSPDGNKVGHFTWSGGSWTENPLVLYHKNKEFRGWNMTGASWNLHVWSYYIIIIYTCLNLRVILNPVSYLELETDWSLQTEVFSGSLNLQVYRKVSGRVGFAEFHAFRIRWFDGSFWQSLARELCCKSMDETQVPGMTTWATEEMVGGHRLVICRDLSLWSYPRH